MKNAMKKNARFVLLIVFLVGLRSVAFAQAGSADLTGRVLDASGAAVANARVTLTAIETGIDVTTNSGADGIYLFSELRPGTYKLVVEANGFRRLEQTGINLRTGDRALIDPPLVAGAKSEAVRGTAYDPLFQTR